MGIPFSRRHFVGGLFGGLLGLFGARLAAGKQTAESSPGSVKGWQSPVTGHLVSVTTYTFDSHGKLISVVTKPGTISGKHHDLQR
jgi:hypothetical protein